MKMVFVQNFDIQLQSWHLDKMLNINMAIKEPYEMVSKIIDDKNKSI